MTKALRIHGTGGPEVFVWDEIAAKSPRSAKVVKIFKDYSATMSKAGPPYRY
ncbi:MAG: hypothetical protein IH993_06045 [Proteobacteria bacterium]|nr:hypothetical protein [Pseudomonadota bacterium]